MNMEFKRKMPTPQAIKEMYPITPELAERKKITDVALRKIFTGEDDRLLLVIGPALPIARTRCSITSRACARFRRRSKTRYSSFLRCLHQ